MDEKEDIGSQADFQLSDNRCENEVRSKEKVTDQSVGRLDHAVGIRDSPLLSGNQDSPSICSPVGGLRQPGGCDGHDGLSSPNRRHKRTKSCPPVERSKISGPWSLEWLHDLNQGDAGVIFSAQKKTCKGGRVGEKHKKTEYEVPRRKKAGGVFRHTLSSLKKVARLPSDERGEVVKVLKKNERRRRDESGAH
ncbi:DUF4283 domain protein, partial [Trifolium medium]|nr:DUF4283 domain protein [Trifolium medium]